MISTEQSSETHGQPTFIGFNYQVLVTVWLALEFIVRQGTPEIIVERPSKEDVTAELKGQNPSTRISTQRYQIQIKLRSSGTWTAKTLIQLVTEKLKKGKPGPKTRIRAFQYLAAEPEEHYLLITTIDVAKELKSHCITEIGEQSHADGLSGLHANPDISRRIGILPGETTANVHRRIELLLQNHCQVSADDVFSCIEDLKEAVRKRLSGTELPALSRADLEEVIVRSRGELLAAVRPTYPVNIGKIREQLTKDHVAILVGPPGTGKTTIALMLADEYRTGQSPAKYRYVREPEHISLIRETINAQNAQVYFVEDPWGQGVLREKARIFTTELAPLLKQARKGKTFIVVSRQDPFQEAVGDRADYNRWAVKLDEKAYSPGDYREIYERQLASWDENAREKALAVSETALKHLLTPYAVTHFCGELKIRTIKGWVSEHEAVKLAKESNVSVFGKRLQERITDSGRKEIIPAIAIWARLTANGDFISAADASQLRSLLQGGGMSDVPDVEGFFDFLTKSNWLQKRARDFTATPSVKEALHGLSSHRDYFADTLESLFRVWCDRKEFHSILLCLRESDAGKSLIPDGVGPAFDVHLVSLAVNSDPRSFIYVFRELATYSTTNHPAAILACALRVDRQGNGFMFGRQAFPTWSPPSDLTAQVIGEITASSDCAACAEKFVVDNLTNGTSHHFFGETYPRERLIGFLELFGWPLREWFEAAVITVLNSPSESTSYLAECLLDLDPSRLDSLVYDVSVSVRTRTPTPDPTSEGAWHRYVEGEDHAWRHGDEGGDERYFFVIQALASAVRRKIQKDRHQWIFGHSHERELLDAWTLVVNGKSDLATRQGFVALCDRYNETKLAAEVIYPDPDPAFHEWAAKKLLETDSQIDSTTKWILLAFSANADFLEMLRLKSGTRFGSVISLLGFIALKDNPAQHEDEPMAETNAAPYTGFEVLADHLTDTQKRSLAACQKDRAARPTETADEIDIAYLSSLAAEWPEIHAIDVLETVSESGNLTDSMLERFLESTDKKIRVRAWFLSQSRPRLLKEALRDSHCECRKVALDQLIELPTPDELHALLALADDASAFVRERLAEQLGNHAITEGIPALIKLLRDPRDYAEEPEHGEERVFTVARKACAALRSFGTLNTETLASLRDFLEGCDASSKDPLVHEKVFEILLHHPSRENIQFCSRYLDTVWADSKWDKLGGYGIVRCCIATVCSHIAHDPDLATGFDFSGVMEIAEWKDDDYYMGILAYALAAVALGHDAVSLDLTPFMVLDTFTERRARLMACVSKRLRNEMPVVLEERLSNQYSFVFFLRWLNASSGVTFAQFSTSHSDFLPWLNSLETGDYLDRLLREVARRLITLGVA